jgi:asparagine synthase (glutamine-hydrolysing)
MSAGLPGTGIAPVRQWAGQGLFLADVPLGPGAAYGTTPVPAADATGELVVVGDFRLDNRSDLLAATRSQPATGLGDPELVLAAYRRWGESCVERLVGDFAFALWDGRRRLVVCARDPFGTKPLYYHLSPSTFAFASDPEAVLRLPDVPRRLNPVAMTDYLYACYEDKEATPWLDVLRLAPGSVLVVDADRVRRRRVWQPDSVRELRLDTDADYEEAFRDALGDAVRPRLPGAGGGVYLSGGLDSSAVTCMAQPHYRGGRLATFSAVFDLDRGSDERCYAAAAAAMAGADPHHVRPERTSPLADWIAAPWKGPAPSCDPQVAVCRAVTESAAEHGASVLLSGFGGDSVVSHGVAYLTELAGCGRPARFVTEVRALARRHNRPVTPLIRTYGLRPFVPAGVLRARDRARGGEFRVGDVWAPVRAEVVRGLRLPQRAADLGQSHLPRTARQAHLAELTSGHWSYALEGAFHTDAVVGIERRYPFLDRRLAELCVSLPGDQKLRDGWTRSIMRRALVGVLPEVVRQRPGKADLSHSFVRGLLGPDRPALETLVARPGLVAEWVDPAALTTLWHRCLRERRSGDCFTLWRVAVLSRWLAHHGFG